MPSIGTWRFVPAQEGRLRRICRGQRHFSGLGGCGTSWPFTKRAHSGAGTGCGCGVEGSNKSATEFWTRVECVRSPAEILEHDAEAVFTRGAIGNKAPGPQRTFGTGVRPENQEGDHPAEEESGAAHTDRRVSDGIAISRGE